MQKLFLTTKLLANSHEQFLKLQEFIPVFVGNFSPDKTYSSAFLYQAQIQCSISFCEEWAGAAQDIGSMFKRSIQDRPDTRKLRKKIDVNEVLDKKDSWLAAWEAMTYRDKVKYWDWITGFEAICYLITKIRHPPNHTSQRQTQWWTLERDTILHQPRRFTVEKSNVMLPSPPGHIKFHEVYSDTLTVVPDSKHLDLIVRRSRDEFDMYIRSQYLANKVSPDSCHLIIYNEGKVTTEVKLMNTQREKRPTNSISEDISDDGIRLEIFTPTCLQFFGPSSAENTYEVVPKEKADEIKQRIGIPKTQEFYEVNAMDRIVKWTGAEETVDGYDTCTNICVQS